jgi:hypothetical protein
MQARLETIRYYAGRRMGDATASRAIAALMDRVGRLPAVNWGRVALVTAVGLRLDRRLPVPAGRRGRRARHPARHGQPHAPGRLDPLPHRPGGLLRLHLPAAGRPGPGHGRPTDLLREIENRLDDYGIDNPHLYSQHLLPASKANPPVVRAHAEEILAAAAAYDDLAAGLMKDNAGLRRDWTGPAGDTAQEHVRSLYDYVTYCHDEALWLGRTGGDCATVLANLRSGHAGVARDHIQAINNAYQGTASWFASWGGFFDHLFGDRKNLTQDRGTGAEHPPLGPVSKHLAGLRRV